VFGNPREKNRLGDEEEEEKKEAEPYVAALPRIDVES